MTVTGYLTPALIALALAIAWVAREAWRAPTVYEDRCPHPELLMERRGGGLECAGPCVDRPPCREGRR